MRINFSLSAESLAPALQRLWVLSGEKIDLLSRDYNPAQGSPVFTVQEGIQHKGWTEWTRGKSALPFSSSTPRENDFATASACAQTTQRMALHVHRGA